MLAVKIQPFLGLKRDKNVILGRKMKVIQTLPGDTLLEMIFVPENA